MVMESESQCNGRSIEGFKNLGFSKKPNAAALI